MRRALLILLLFFLSSVEPLIASDLVHQEIFQNKYHRTQYAGYAGGIFYWYISAKTQPKQAPIIIWTSGGPGTSSLYGLLKENGPFLVEAQEPPFTKTFLVKNDYGWHKEANLLYVDNPIGTGFSHNSDGLQSNSFADDEIASHLKEFIFLEDQIKRYTTKEKN